MVNNSGANSYNLECIVDGTCKIIEYFPETNTTNECKAVYDGRTTKVNVGFLPMQSHVLIVQENAEQSSVENEPREQFVLEPSSCYLHQVTTTRSCMAPP